MHHLFSHLIQIASTAPIKIPADGITPTGNTTIGGGITRVIALIMQLIGMLSVIFIIVGGLQTVLAAGNPARLKQGRETIIYAVVGIGVAISGYAIVSFLAGKLGG